MKETIKNEKYGEITYEEGFFSGKKSLKINGYELSKTYKNRYLYIKDKVETELFLNGNILTGVKINDGIDTIQIVPSIKWYELVMSLLIFVIILIWGNSIDLCLIVPIVGGAIGGAISGLMMMVNILIIKNQKNIFVKIGVSVAVLLVTFGICALIASAILS